MCVGVTSPPAPKTFFRAPRRLGCPQPRAHNFDAYISQDLFDVRGTSFADPLLKQSICLICTHRMDERSRAWFAWGWATVGVGWNLSLIHVPQESALGVFGVGPIPAFSAQ
ncbi:Hypothetical predicted protein [Olea europaea subsp. europaea]|uniref:Uncharacterized protein n=1 Tax=Olea europaea subsp. europaea TaxID=158383 RepID=A0A8S0SE45_OLEEU|nr:Hypothetical predicted protein [Olea europaea subsp. europaea]